MTKSLEACQRDATVLAGMLEALDLMNGNSEFSGEAQASLTIAAREKATQLADDLERLEGKQRVAA